LNVCKAELGHEGLLQNYGQGGGFCLKKKKDEVTIRSSAAEYLTYVASVGDQQDSIEMRYEEENIWLTQKMMANLQADDLEVLKDAGKITAEIAKTKAETEFEKYRVIQDRLFMPDYDKYLLELEESAKK
jgi:hypothetical protein